MRRTSHPNLKPGQRKSRRDPLAEWMDARLRLGRAKELRAEMTTNPDVTPCQLADMDRRITEFQAWMDAGMPEVKE